MAQGRGNRCTPGTIYYGNFEGEGRCKAVYIDHYSLESGDSAYLLAIPADGTQEKDHAVTMIGGDDRKLAEKDYVRLVAVRQMNGYRTSAPKVPYKQWSQEAAPRLDRLKKLAEEEQRTWPVNEAAGAVHFVLSDGVGDATDGDPDSPNQKDAGTKGGLRILRTEDLLESTAQQLADRLLDDAGKTPLSSVRGQSLEERSSGGGFVGTTQSSSTRDHARGRPPIDGLGGLDGDALMTTMRGAMKTNGTSLFGNASSSMSDEQMSDLLRRVRRNLGSAPKDVRHARGGDDDPGGDDSSPDASSSSSDSDGKRGGRRKKKKKKSKKKKRKSRRDDSSSSNSSCERGRGANKLRRYEKLKAKQRKHPLERWSRLEELARDAGFSGTQMVELYLHETTKLSKSKFLVYLAAGLARIGRAAAAGESEMAAGLTASVLGFLDQIYLTGDVETGWRSTLEGEPVAIQRQPTMQRATGLPDSGPKNLTNRLKFSVLIPPDVLEVTLESARQWSVWDALQKQTQ